MSKHQHSRLGQILINKGLITRQQLDAAITIQLTSNKRLGEILIEQGLLTERQLKKALSKQTNLRLAATLVAALLSPFQIIYASTPDTETAFSQQDHLSGLRPLSDLEMSEVSAQGLDDALQGLLLQAEGGSGLSTVAKLSKLVMPVLNNLEAEVSMKDVQYDISKLTSTINADGSVNVRLPSSIGELKFDNIRVAGAGQNQSFGNLSLHDIDLSQASLRVTLNR
ncbi:hypothetical protein [Pseudomonas sp. TTU2014-080ASC]|uniref:hypothetical protein n=1 Tax=Pseudomonas sp. TTU2014-080ASC TaxID=1729724 RepID=UPI0007187646|nr:hypothetical protein [Pseudomonas sp. TTU2014-080ASC]KRW60013.1 hypothetical protein AO726_10835 [Pseudomonas sp. TTU2014-080ASC]